MRAPWHDLAAMWQDGRVATLPRHQEEFVADGDDEQGQPEPEGSPTMEGVPEGSPTMEGMAEGSPTPEGVPAESPGPRRRRRRKKSAAAAVVSTAGGAVDAVGGVAPTEESQGPDRTATDAPPATAETTPQASSPAEAPPPEEADVPTPATVAATSSARASRGPSVWIATVALLLLLAIAGGIGFGAASLVPGFADAQRPLVTLPPPTPKPTLPPLPTEEPTITPEPLPTPSPTPSPKIHIVKKGQNLTQIAARYGVTVEAIASANGITNPNLIEPGQKLIIPSR